MPKLHPSRILYEDDDLLAVTKLSGELVVAAPGEGHKKPLYDFLHTSYPGLRVVHRLDYPTSGVLVFAKHAEALRGIRESKFAGWKKTYRALVAGKMKQPGGTIVRKLPARTQGELVDAETQYRVLRLFEHVTYVECIMETGRRHQIRRHLQFIGHPLLLDPLYGDKKADHAFRKHFRFDRFFLHAISLDFPHPVTGKEMHISSPLPPVFSRVVEEMGHSA